MTERFNTKTRALRARVGDVVTFDCGGGLMVTGTLVEYRGAVGSCGRRLWRVRVDAEENSPSSFFDLAEEDFLKVRRGEVRA